jgi:hypothetical protein
LELHEPSCSPIGAVKTAVDPSITEKVAPDSFTLDIR